MKEDQGKPYVSAGPEQRTAKRSHNAAVSKGNGLCPVAAAWGGLAEQSGVEEECEILIPGRRGRQRQSVASSCGSEGDALVTAYPSQRRCSTQCADALHELSNVLTGVLVNAQMLQWKLPPYSHLKRSVREVERNAQRGSELLRRLVRRLAEQDAAPVPKAALEEASADGGEQPLVPRLVEGAPGAAVSAPAKTQPGDTSPASSPDGAVHLTSDCDPCTSSFFPKRDDGIRR